MSDFLHNTKIDFMKPHKVIFFASMFCILASILLVIFRGLNLGIDFSGGVLIEAKLNENFDVAQVRKMLEVKEIGKADIQSVEGSGLMIRISKSENQEKAVKLIQEILGQNFKNIEYRKIDSVGPQIGSELITKGVLAVFLAFISIAIYVWIRFDWQYGLGAILALIHDVALTFGFYVITGLEFNLTSIAAILTIVGFSINDSVVIYDRIRENLRKFKKTDLGGLINDSLNSTLSRTVLTSGTALVSVLALVLFGGEVLKSFSLAMFFGIIIGTYSSIYVSAPILMYLDPRKKDQSLS